MIRGLILAAFGLLLTSAVHAEEWRSYTNPRFGVSADYPAVFSRRDEPPANGDGQGFSTPDGRAHLIIFGSYNIDHETPAQLMVERKEAKTSYSYQKAGKGWFALSGTHGDAITYVRCNLGREDVVGCVHLEYPAGVADNWAKAVTRISKSLRVGR